MKIMQLLSLSYSSLSSFATDISNQKIKGLKARSKLLMTAIAQTEGLSLEALQNKLNKLHSDSYEFVEKEVKFDHDGKDIKLSQIAFTITVKGIPENQHIRVFNGIYDMDDYVSDIMPTMHMPTVARSGVDTNEIIRKMQLAYSVASELCIYINKNKRALTPEKMMEEGWRCKVGVGSRYFSDELRDSMALTIKLKDRITNSQIYAHQSKGRLLKTINIKPEIIDMNSKATMLIKMSDKKNRLNNQARNACLAYVARSYPEWPESDENSHTSATHCGYAWERDTAEHKHWQLVHRGNGDIVVRNDVVFHRAECALQSALPVGEVFLESKIIEQAEQSGLGFNRIGNNAVGEGVLVVNTALAGVMSFMLVSNSNKGAYRRVI